MMANLLYTLIKVIVNIIIFCYYYNKNNLLNLLIIYLLLIFLKIDLKNGHSYRNKTFKNKILSLFNDFYISDLELWTFD